MSLSFLSGIETDYLGLDEVGARQQRRRPQRRRQALMIQDPAAAVARRQAGDAIRTARLEAMKARRAFQIARLQTQAANDATQQAVSADFGKRKNKQERQQAQQQKQQAKQQQQTAKRAQAAAKKQAQTARKAAQKAQGAARKAARATQQAARQSQKQTAKTQKVQQKVTRRAIRPAAAAARRADKVARRAAVPAPIIRRKALPPAAPIIEELEDMQAEEMTPEEPEEFIEDDDNNLQPEMDAEDDMSDEEGEALEGNYLGLDEIGNKAKRQAKRGAKKQKRATKKAGKPQRKAAQKAKKTARGGSRLKKVALAPARAAFTTLLRLNLLKTASKIAAGYKRNPAAVKAFAARFGFKWENFATAVSKGSKTQISGLGEPVTAGAVLTAAAPIIAALPVLLKTLGVKMDKQTADATRTAQQATQDNVNTAEDAEARDEGRPSRAGFKLSTPLLIAGAAAAFFVFNRK